MPDLAIWTRRRATRDECDDAGVDRAARPIALLDHSKTVVALTDRTQTSVLWTAAGVRGEDVRQLLTAGALAPERAEPVAIKHRFRVHAAGATGARRIGVGAIAIPWVGARLSARREIDWTV